MPRRHGTPKTIQGWVGGVLENIPAEPAPEGALSSATNLVKKPGTKMATRGGSRTMRAFTDGAANNLTDIVFVRAYSQTGAVVVGWRTASSKHWAFLADGSLSSEGTRVELPSWTTGPARPFVVELWENLYVCDTNETYASRLPLVEVTKAGTASAFTQDFGGGAGAVVMKPRVLESYGGVLFAAGFDGPANAQDRSILHHSYLGRSPSNATGWSDTGWAIVGEKGKEITALRAGAGVLLVAKADGLYRVYGTPLALDGWQFAIEPLDFGVGYGCTNPYAIDYHNGWWYGIGESGPWRTNGEVIENLADRMRDSWNALDVDMSLAWVSAHPDRGVVLFGIPNGSNPPNTVWVWDTAAEGWMGSWVFSGLSIPYGSAVVSTEVVGPTGPPSAPSTTVVTQTGWTCNWTNGDTLAQTEVWIRTRGDVGNGTDGAWELYATVDPNTATKAVTGKVGYTHYQWRTRHVKGGVYSDYCTTQDVYTDIIAPTWIDCVVVNDMDLMIRVRVQQYASESTITIQHREVDASCGTPGAWSTIHSAVWPIGPVTAYDTGATWGNYYQYQARAEDATWPGAVKTSGWVQCTTPTCIRAYWGTGGGGSGGPPYLPE